LDGFGSFDGIGPPWYVQSVDFEADKHLLTIAVDFIVGSRFAHPDAPGEHPVHDTRTKRLRHLNLSSEPSPSWRVTTT
jgi:transposase